MIPKEEIRGLYKSLTQDTKDMLRNEYDADRLTNDTFVRALIATTNEAMQLAVTVAVEQPMKEEQLKALTSDITIKEAQNTKQLQLMDKQILDVVSTTTQRDTQSAKDLLVKSQQITSMVNADNDRVTELAIKRDTANAQISLINKQILDVASQITIREAQSINDTNIKTAQVGMINNQAATELKKALLTVRQTTMYDDNLRVEEGKMLTNVVGMYGAGGTALPTGLETQMINAVNAVTP